MSIKRRVIRRVIRRERKTDSVMSKGNYTLTTKCQSYLGWHKAGETGKFLNQGNGVGNFFPDRGGVILNLPCSSVARTCKDTTEKFARPCKSTDSKKKQAVIPHLSIVY